MKRLLAAFLFATLPLLAQDKISLENRVSPAPSGTQYAIPYATSTTAIGWLAHATGLQCFHQNGAAAPYWDSCSGGGTVTSITATAPLTGGTITGSGSIGCATMVASGGSHAAGCVGDPGSSAGSTKFWREDATFAVPAGGGSGTVDGISTVTLVAGTNVTISDDTPSAGDITISASGGSGGNATSTGAFASRPGTCTNGDLYLPSDAPYTLRCLSNAWAAVGTLWTLPNDSLMSWVNQGNATVSQANGFVYMENTSTPSGTYNAEMRLATAPTAPFTATAFIDVGQAQTLDPGPISSSMYGIWQRESSSGKLRSCVFYVTPSSGFYAMMFDYWSGPTVPVSGSNTAFGGAYNGSSFWIRLYDDNTNVNCQFSRDGVNFWTFSSLGRTASMTADQIGYGINGPTTTKPTMHVYSWKVQ
jgi:hypothetical protein